VLDYQLKDNVACITIDDGKANAVSHAFIDAITEGFDRAVDEAGAVLVKGRAGLLSGGFDLKEFQKGPDATTALVNRGAELLLRMFTLPKPLIIANTGHAVAAGAFMLLTADTRIGVRGDFKIGLNETAIGMTLPVFGIQLARARLSMRHQTETVIQGELLDPEHAHAAGFLDALCEEADLDNVAMQSAVALAQLPSTAYTANKLAIREPYIEAIEKSLAS